MKPTQLFEIYATAMAEALIPVRGWKYLNPKERAAFEALEPRLAAAYAKEQAP